MMAESAGGFPNARPLSLDLLWLGRILRCPGPGLCLSRFETGLPSLPLLAELPSHAAGLEHLAAKEVRYARSEGGLIPGF